ncbi:MAG: class I SAM-dependent methyltransferase [Bacteroidota bacterium]
MLTNNTFTESNGKWTYSACPSCGSSDLLSIFYAKDYTVSQESFEILECQNCSLRFTQNIPSPSKIGPYYQSEEYISHTNTNKGIVNQLYQLVRNYTLGQKLKTVQKVSGLGKGRILDIGCGTGDFLGTMKNGGWDVLGLEPDDNARKMAVENHGILAFPSDELFNLEDNSFDVISMWHVLEHVHELHKYLEKIRSLLKPSGTLLIAVPNYTSGDASHYQHEWAAYDVPRHLYHFSPTGMEGLLNQHGFKLDKMKHMVFDSFYVSLLSEKYKSGKVKLIGGFLNGFSSFLKAMGKPENCSSVLYIFKKED